MENTLLQHLVKAQFYRWFQVYERPRNSIRLKNQVELFADEIIIDNPLNGERRGKAACAEALALLKEFQNAHHISDIHIEIQGGATALLTATVRYQTIHSDSTRFSYTIAYTVLANINQNNLPQLSKVTIKPIEQTQESFKDAYPTNRVKSLIYYWLALVERLESNPSPFTELLADGFQFNLPSGILRTLDDFQAWILKRSTQLCFSSHFIRYCDIEVKSENRFHAVFECSWKGRTKSGEQLTAVTRHTWDILNNLNARFAQIKSARIEALEPFTVIS